MNKPSLSRRRHVWLAAAVTLATLTGVALAPRQSVAGPQATFNIRDDKPGAPINTGLFGSNLQWEKDGDGLLHRNDWAPGVVAKLAEAGISNLRFPGGDLANTYRWRAGIGPRGQRPPGRDYAGKEAASNFGTDELIELCRKTGIEPLLTVNVTAGATEAADWVDYVNNRAPKRFAEGKGDSKAETKGDSKGDTALPKPQKGDDQGSLQQVARNEGKRDPKPGPGDDAKGGAEGRAKDVTGPSCRAVYWEVGNENYNPLQPGHLSATEYAKRFLEYAKAMRARDPSIKVGLLLESSFTQAAWMRNVYPHMLTWNEDVLKIAGKDADFVSLHYYAPHDKKWLDSDLHELVMAGPVVFEQNLKLIRELLQRYARPNTEVLVTEYGVTYGDKVAPSERISSTESALFIASMIFAFARDGRIARANHWSFANNSQYGTVQLKAGEPAVERVPFRTFQLLRRFGGMRLLPVESSNVPTFSVGAQGNIPALSNVPAIDTLAAVDSAGRILAAAVNRSPNKTLPITVTMSKPRQIASSWQIVAGGVASRKWSRQEKVAAQGDGRTWTFELPPASIGLVTFEAK